MPSCSAAPIVLSDDEREQLERWTRRRSSAQALALRADRAAGRRGPEEPRSPGGWGFRARPTKWRNRLVVHRPGWAVGRAASHARPRHVNDNPSHGHRAGGAGGRRFTRL